ncbi:MAG: hypothetical protein JXQ90_12220 [Cyclobacteriaceae bacterium]
MSCNESDLEAKVPGCIQQEIDEMTTCGEEAAVEEYLFQNDTVFVFHMGNCPDAGSSVLDSECNYLGLLGGIAALREINGVDFWENATLIRVVWEEE